ncbi:MAG: aminopeptidase [Acidobacteria bacterium]|nr:MAG: aminopeptidase [Acidobacteriota bacterium]
MKPLSHAAIIMLAAHVAALHSQTKPRARDLGVPFHGQPGPVNAITDVAGVEVGMTTLISGSGALKIGSGPVRTGVTAILPRGKGSNDPVFAGWFSLNGNGEMTGTTWLEEGGFLEGPVFITNTHSVGVVRDAAIKWSVDHGYLHQPWSLPVVAETWDGSLNDINGFHVKPEHVVAALDGARRGAVAEGNVGGGTGMRCYGFKCGTGTSSRKIDAQNGGYTVGVLVQANHGTRDLLRVAGVPVSSNGSGDIFIAFSTANAGAAGASNTASVSLLSNEKIGSVFEATVDASEEAIINALVAAETMVGVDGHRAEAIPHDRLREILRKYNRLVSR